MAEVPGYRPTSCRWPSATTRTERTERTGLYLLLGMDESSSLPELRAAARSLLSRSHPDLGGDPSTFQAALEAWDAFKDAASRERYDASSSSDQPQPGAVGTSITFTAVPDAGGYAHMSWRKDPWEAVGPEPAERWAEMVASALWDARACMAFEVGAASSASRWWIEGGVSMGSSSVEPTRADAAACAMLLVAGCRDFGSRVALQ